MELSPPRAESELRGRRRSAVVQPRRAAVAVVAAILFRVKGWRKMPDGSYRGSSNATARFHCGRDRIFLRKYLDLNGNAIITGNATKRIM